MKWLLDLLGIGKKASDPECHGSSPGYQQQAENGCEDCQSAKSCFKADASGEWK